MIPLKHHRSCSELIQFCGTKEPVGMALFRKCRIELKTFCRCYCGKEDPNTTLKSHPYCIPPFSSYAELTDLLLKNVIYKHNGLLILNRPHGLKKVEPAERGFWLKKIKLNISPSLAATDKLSFTGVLPYLKKALNVHHLELLKAPDRHMSGIAILSYHDKDVPKRVTRALNPPHVPKYTFLAVCDGVPFVESNSVKLGLTLTERHSTKKLTFVEKYSKRSMEAGKVYPFTVNHKIVSVNDKMKVSLVELETTKNKWNGVRAFCAMRLLSPALGDEMFGCCIQEVQKTRIALDPLSPAANKPYRISSAVLNAIGLKYQQQKVVPLHIHLAKLNFLKYRTDGRVFTAKPPDHFLWTCDQLGLTVPVEYSENQVSDRIVKSENAEMSEEEEIVSLDEDEDEDEAEDEPYSPIVKSSQPPTANYEEIRLEFDDPVTERIGSRKKR